MLPRYSFNCFIALFLLALGQSCNLSPSLSPDFPNATFKEVGKMPKKIKKLELNEKSKKRLNKFVKEFIEKGGFILVCPENKNKDCFWLASMDGLKMIGLLEQTKRQVFLYHDRKKYRQIAKSGSGTIEGGLPTPAQKPKGVYCNENKEIQTYRR